MSTDQTALRFLALGDSYTIGEAVDPEMRWPVQLANLLGKRGHARIEPQIIARTGWTTDELRSAIRDESPRGPYQLVSLLIGVNNQYRGRDSEEYRKEFSELLGMAIRFAGDDPRRVIVLSIPDWGVTPFAEGRSREEIAEQIDRFNTINREVTLSRRAHYVEVTTISRKAATDASLLASDGLHPSGAMYRRWAELALPAAMSALR
ncbi:MAG TPA: SGNH/GDSL hydrolase family protein [Thermoanaerobaculia bacterium]|nr:SGNH/GDSL hydrolase family protein [Thermoanaerobaculia bacterium]